MDVALKLSKGLDRSSELFEAGAGVSRSIRRPSSLWVLVSLLRLGCDPRAGVRLRVSSNVGIVRTGETGTVGLRMDFKGKAAVDYATTNSYFVSKIHVVNEG